MGMPSMENKPWSCRYLRNFCFSMHPSKRDFSGQMNGFLGFFWPCGMAYGILLRWPGIEPGYPAVEGWSLKHWTGRKIPRSMSLTLWYLLEPVVLNTSKDEHTTKTKCPTRSVWATGFKGKNVFFGQAWNKSLIGMDSGGGNVLYCPSVCIWVSRVQLGEGKILGSVWHVVLACSSPRFLSPPTPLVALSHSAQQATGTVCALQHPLQCLQDPTGWDRVQRGSLPAAQMAQTLGEEEMLPIVWLLFPFHLNTFYLFIFKKYLFIWLHRMLVATHRIFSLCWGRRASLAVAWELLLRHVGPGSPTRDQTCAPCIGSVESQPLAQQRSPNTF